MPYHREMKILKESDLDLLLRRKWDPRVGMTKGLGVLEWVFGLMLSFSIIAAMTGIVYPSKLADYSGLGAVGAAFLLAVCWAIPNGTKERTRRRVERQGYFLCPWCRSALGGLGDEGECPECGARYKRELCETLYECAYKKYKPDRAVLARREARAWREAIRLRDGGQNHPSVSSQ